MLASRVSTLWGDSCQKYILQDRRCRQRILIAESRRANLGMSAGSLIFTQSFSGRLTGALTGLLCIVLSGCSLLHDRMDSRLSLSVDDDEGLQRGLWSAVKSLRPGDRASVAPVSGADDDNTVTPPRYGHSALARLLQNRTGRPAQRTQPQKQRDDEQDLPRILPASEERSLTDRLVQQQQANAGFEGPAVDRLLQMRDVVAADAVEPEPTQAIPELLRNFSESTSPRRQKFGTSSADLSGDLQRGDSVMSKESLPATGLHEEDAAVAAETRAGVDQEDTVLDRFRQFYGPGFEENTDRLRRQVRRFSDPFGLLKEKPTEPETVADGDPDGLVASEPVVTAQMDAPYNRRAEENRLGLLQLAIESLRKELQEWPRDGRGNPRNLEQWRRRQTDLSMLNAVSGDAADSVRTIEGLPPQEQEFWQALMLAVGQYRDSADAETRPGRVSETLDYLRQAESSLRPLSKLSVYRLQFCGRVDGFGMLTPLPSVEFEPGQRMLLYAGIRNFSDRLTADGFHSSEFSAVIEFIRDSDGGVAETIRLPEIQDRCDEKRTDFYQTYELTAPLLEGQYTVKLYLEDLLTGQRATNSVRMMVR